MTGHALSLRARRSAFRFPDRDPSGRPAVAGKPSWRRWPGGGGTAGGRRRGVRAGLRAGRRDRRGEGEPARILLDQIDALTRQIDALSDRVSELIAQIPAAQGVDADGSTGPDAGYGPGAPVLSAVARLDEITGCGIIAASASRTDTFLGERYRRLARKRGKRKALAAIARSILVTIFHLLADPKPASATSDPATTTTTSAGNARSATTSASSRPSASRSPSPRLPDPYRPAGPDPSAMARVRRRAPLCGAQVSLVLVGLLVGLWRLRTGKHRAPCRRVCRDAGPR